MNTPPRVLGTSRARARRIGRALFSAALLLASLSACEGERGESGGFTAFVQRTGDVLEADLSEFGITQAGALPDPAEEFALTANGGRVFWTSNWDGPEVRYLVTVKLKPRQGEQGDSGLFPVNDAVDLPPLTADTGDAGDDIALRFLIRRNELHVFRLADPRQGTPVD